MLTERFGPLASKKTLHKLIQYLSLTDQQLDEKQVKFNGKPLSHTMKATALGALRRLTEQNFGYDPEASVKKNSEALNRWKEWWYRNQHDLLYVVDPKLSKEEKPYPEEQFHYYPEHRYITVKREVGVRGRKSPEELYKSFRTAWNQENWQKVVNLLVVHQRNKETLDHLFTKYGYGSDLGYFRRPKDTNVPGRKTIEFNFKQGTSELQAEKDGGEWYIRVDMKNKNSSDD